MALYSTDTITKAKKAEDKEAIFAQLLDNAVKGSEMRISQSKRNRAFLYGKHWQQKVLGEKLYNVLCTGRFEWLPNFAGEEIQQHIQNLQPILVRSKPGTIVKPEDMGRVDLREMDDEGVLRGDFSELTPDEVAEYATAYLDALREKRSQNVMDATIIGEVLISGIAYVGWTVQRGINGTEMFTRLIEPDCFLPDPDSKHAWNFDDARYIIEKEMMSTVEIEHYHKMKPDEYGGKEPKFSLENILGTIGIKPASIEGMEPLQQYPVYTLYYKDVMPASAGILGDNRKKAGGIMRLTFVNGKYKPHSQIESPFAFDDFPYTAFQCLPKPFEAYGVSDVATLMGTQVAINIARGTMLGSMLWNTNPGYEIETNAAEHLEVDYTPGGRNVWADGAIRNQKFQPRQPADMASSINGYQLFKGQADERISDSQGMLRGGRGGAQSGRHASIILNSVLTAHSYRVTNLDASWRRLAHQEFSNIQRFGEETESRIQRMLGFSELQPSAQVWQAIKNLRYDIDIQSKESMPSAVDEKLNLFLALYDRGLIDPEGFYKETGIPIDAELAEKVSQASRDFIVGAPMELQVQMAVQQEQQIDQLAAQGGLQGETA